jgi:hypothetical protein
MRIRIAFVVMVAAVAAMFFNLVRPATTAPATVQSDDLVLEAGALALWENDGGVVTPRALTLAPEAPGALFTSAPLDAPLPFNAVVVRWGPLPAEDAQTVVALYLRSAPAGGEWSEWQEVEPSGDLTLPEDELLTGDFIILPAESGRHERVQFRAQLYAAPDGTLPRLERLEATFIDSTAGPTSEELEAQAQALPQPAAPANVYPKPTVIPRSVWCLDPKCNYSDGLSYSPVTHLLLHHTVSGGGMDSAVAMRAIWYYHTVTRGWGDIGYNYLVDADGRLYEGHLGGDDVIGTHAGAANAGSMALSMIGDFTSVAPPLATRNAAAELFAWKAAQKGIDVYSASRPVAMSWGLPHLSGHRDVYGTTACPGDSGHPWLPWLRDEVARRIGFTPEHVYFDELNPATHFTKSAVNWYSTSDPALRNCGINGHAWFTWSVTDPSKATNWGEWRPEITAPGRYELSIFAPYCYTKKSDTHGARYEVNHAGGRSYVTVDQGARLGLWTSLGEYNLYAGTSNMLRLTDLTTTDSGYGVWFDAIRVRYIKPSATPVSPANTTVTNAVPFSWNVAVPESLGAQRLQVATDAGFGNIILDESIPLGTTSVQRAVPHMGGQLYWRIRLISTRGDVIDSALRSFTLLVDTVPPTSTISGIYRLWNLHYAIAWQGQDDQAGVAGYNIDYRLATSGTWTRWLSNTPANSAYFIPPQPGTYWFRSQAIDHAGNAEAIHPEPGDMNTNQALFLPEHQYMPLVHR